MKNISFYLKILQFLEVKFSIYLNRRVFVMYGLVAFCSGISNDVYKFATLCHLHSSRGVMAFKRKDFFGLL